ncbi:MAG TPA: DUF2167 domain-containing protein [Planctomycetota bacterium]|jgi:uncharacterized membrane-anchored protein|nr:DUF2167 domain-containing protein [Planctomycetota bacterium]
MLRRLLLPAVALFLSAFPAAGQDAQDKKDEAEPQENHDAAKPDGEEPESDEVEQFRKGLRLIDPKIEWEEGPCDGPIGDVAKLAVPAGVAFTGKEGTRRFIVALKNLPGGQIATAQWLKPPFWQAYFSINAEGYIKDLDKDELDADKLLGTLQEGCKLGNEERRKRGIDPFEISGWAVPPHYDEATHNLEWGTRLHGESGEDTVNYEIRMLSRSGYVSSMLVCSPDELTVALPQFRKLIGALAMNSGKSYDEMKPGDPIADATLTTLIVGGAAALGWKAGIFKYLYKIVIAIGVGVAALWRKITGRSKPSPKPAA